MDVGVISGVGKAATFEVKKYLYEMLLLRKGLDGPLTIGAVNVERGSAAS